MLELAVIGAGVMGSNHARVAMSLPRAKVCWVVDLDPVRGKSLAERVGASYVGRISDLPGSVDAAIVALPTADHRRVAEELLARGVHVLVEKPIAGTVDDAKAIVAAARSAGKVLTVGHVERFNPVILQLAHILNDVIHLEINRTSPFAKRVADSVVVDLMIHDLDIARAIAGSEVSSVRAVSQQVRSETIDLAVVLLEFESGATASLTASRLGQEKIRLISITEEDRYITLDLLRQDIRIARVEHSEFVSNEGVRYRQQGMVEIPYLERQGEPLYLELEEFVAAVAEARHPRVTGEDGLIALELAHDIEAILGASVEVL